MSVPESTKAWKEPGTLWVVCTLAPWVGQYRCEGCRARRVACGPSLSDVLYRLPGGGGRKTLERAAVCFSEKTSKPRAKARALPRHRMAHAVRFLNRDWAEVRSADAPVPNEGPKASTVAESYLPR